MNSTNNGQRARSDAGPASGRYSVLVLDDDRAIVETLVAMLEPYHDAVGTSEPSVALSYLARREFHVAIADWIMPTMSGVEFFHRANALGRPLGCLLITARFDEFASEVEHDLRKALGVLAKPIREAQLLERVGQLGRLAAMKQSIRKMRGAYEGTG
ncbi:MAG: response regulator [Polyangiaceae bacterium]|nr:response regulator [Polyangiaceae bacterium]